MGRIQLTDDEPHHILASLRDVTRPVRPGMAARLGDPLANCRRGGG